MARKKLDRPVLKQRDQPFEITVQMRFYFSICDENPYAAYLLDYCYGQQAVSLYEYRQNRRPEQSELERRLAKMPPEEREAELDRINDKALEKWENRQINFYEGDEFLNDEEDALEGANGIFDFSMEDAVTTACESLYGRKSQREELEQHLWEAYKLLSKKGFLRRIALRDWLDSMAIEGALQALYPGLYEQEEDDERQRRKREATKVQHHVNMARRLGLPSTLTLPEWLETLSYFNWTCAYCRNAPYAVLEHVRPVILGGGTTAFNCVPACERCNLLKLDTPPELLPPGFGTVLERMQCYLNEKKRRYLQNSNDKH
ncbi:MAG: HNH endonuclease [Rhabdochlamydiaceae bacterium]